MLNISKRNLKKEIEDQNLYSIKILNNFKGNRVAVRWLSGLMIVLFLSLFLPWQQNVESQGIVTALNPQDRPQDIQSIIAGRIEKWHIREGDFVRQGDTILLLSEIKDKFFDQNILQRTNQQIQSKIASMESKKNKAQALSNQVLALREALRLSTAKARNKIIQGNLKVTSDSIDLVASRTDLTISQRQYEAQKKLYDQGLKSLTELENRNLKLQQAQAKVISAENKYLSSKNELINAQIELGSILAEYNDKIAKSESERSATLADVYETESTLGKMNIDYANLETRSELYVVRAPQNGYILQAAKEGLGETIKEGEAICTIMPENHSVAVALYVKPMDLPLLYRGCPVRIQFDGWPALVFSGWPNASVGTFGGLVQVIDKVNSKNGKFRVLVTPDPKDDPWPEKVRIGTGANGWAMMNNVLLSYELWRQFNGFPADYTTYGHLKEKDLDAKAKKSKSPEEEDEY